MRTFTEKEKLLIKQLHQHTSEGIDTINWIKSLFNDKMSALLLMSGSHQVYVFGESDLREKIIKTIVSIVSLIEDLKQEGIIYILPQEDSYVLLHDSNSILLGVENQDSLSFEGGKISINEEDCKWYDTSGVLKSTGYLLPLMLSNKIKETILSTIYLTPKFDNLIKSDFESIEIKSYQQAISDAKKSRNVAWVALLLSLLVQPLMTLFNNRFSLTELKSDQYNGIVNTIGNQNNQVRIINYNIESLKEKTDSISIFVNNINQSLLDCQKEIRSINTFLRSNKDYTLE